MWGQDPNCREKGGFEKKLPFFSVEPCVPLFARRAPSPCFSPPTLLLQEMKNKKKDILKKNHTHKKQFRMSVAFLVRLFFQCLLLRHFCLFSEPAEKKREKKIFSK